MVGDVMVGVALSAYAVSVLGSVTMCISVSVMVSVLEVLILYDCLVLKLSLLLVNIRPLSVSQLFVLSFGYFQLNTISVIVIRPVIWILST